MRSTYTLLLLGASLGALHGVSIGIWGVMTGALLYVGVCAAGIVIHDAAEMLALRPVKK